MTKVVLDETEYMQMKTKLDKLAHWIRENKSEWIGVNMSMVDIAIRVMQRFEWTNFDEEMARLEVENRNLKLLIKDLNRVIADYEIRELEVIANE